MTSLLILVGIPTFITIQEAESFSSTLPPPPPPLSIKTSTSSTQLYYTPPSKSKSTNKQDESTKLYYVPTRGTSSSSGTRNNNNNKDETKTLFYAPNTDPEYEKTPFSFEKLKAAVIGGRRPASSTSRPVNCSTNSMGKMVPIRKLKNINGEYYDIDDGNDDAVIFVVDNDDATVPFLDKQSQQQPPTSTNKDSSFFMAKSLTTTIQENTFFGSFPSSSSTTNKVKIEINKPDQKSIYKPHSALDDLPNALGYATSLSVAGLASGMTMAAKTLANGLEQSAKLTQSLESSFADIAVQIKDDNGMNVFDNVTQKIRHGSNQLKHDFEHKPIPELIQSFLDTASTTSSSFFDNMPMTKTKQVKKPKIASVPPPLNDQYYTPFEACNILYHHEMDPLLNKPKAMKIMLENNYIPVGRSQIYRIFKQFKLGKIQESKKWGERGRPRKVQFLP